MTKLYHTKGWLQSGILPIAAILLTSCVAPPTPQPAPYAAILPPGAPTVVQVQKNAPSPVQRTAFVAPVPAAIFTCDFGDGHRDGENVYFGPQVGKFTQTIAFPVTNLFTLLLPTNIPTFIEVRSFINWPAPGIVQTVTNDDGSISSSLVTFREGAPDADPTVADYVYVPTNCPVLALMQYSDHFTVVGWAANGAVLRLIGSPTLDKPLSEWEWLDTINGTNGPFATITAPGMQFFTATNVY